MRERLVIRYVAGVVVVVFALGIIASGDRVEVSWLRYFSAAVLAATLGLWLWDHFLWRLQWLQKIPSVPRNVSGTWSGTLASHWVDPRTKTRIEAKAAYVVIRQTSSSARITLLTDESKSVTSLAVVNRADPDTWVLDHMYLNSPDLGVRDRSAMHHGSGSLRIAGNPAQRLAGSYWTDRDTKGEFHFDRRSKKQADDYQGAVTLFS